MPVKGWVPKATRRNALKDCCESCGAGSLLGLHHKDGDRMNNSLENLATLCASCHTSEHWRTGKQPWRRHPSSCVVCGKQPTHSGLCETHRTRLRRYGSPYLRNVRSGAGWQLVWEAFGPPSGPIPQGWLMGCPLGWTDCEHSETESSRNAPNLSD